MKGTNKSATSPAKGTQDVTFVWLEITGHCQLECVHCYADSGPTGSHGSMTSADWGRVIDECADMGVGMVQFIGGEPSLHPDLPALIDRALGRGIGVEVFSNLVHVTPTLWSAFGRPGVRLACSYYSDNPMQHAAVTNRSSHERTNANIAETVRRSIPLRIGIIDLYEGQRVHAAIAELKGLGVNDIGVDRLRQVGRGVRDAAPRVDQLCGRCGAGNIAIAPDGSVWPCVFTRWLPVGNVREADLAGILAGEAIAEVRRDLETSFAARPCVPNMCNPQCGPSCSPACRPANNCRPVGACAPWYR